MIDINYKDNVKTQLFVMGEWITVKSFSLENINDIHCIFVHVEGVAKKHLRSIADWMMNTWKVDIVAIVAT